MLTESQSARIDYKLFMGMSQGIFLIKWTSLPNVLGLIQSVKGLNEKEREERGESHGQRKLVRYSPWGRKRSWTWVSDQLTHISSNSLLINRQISDVEIYMYIYKNLNALEKKNLLKEELYHHNYIWVDNSHIFHNYMCAINIWTHMPVFFSKCTDIYKCISLEVLL